MSTVVRPSQADLSAIARRISGPLSPEGAESWYRQDAATLLQEVVTLRREAEEARRRFLSDGMESDHDVSLYELAEAWKATATGYWEKVQTKRLNQRIHELTKLNEAHQAEITSLKHLRPQIREMTEAAEELQEQMARERQEYEHEADLLKAAHIARMAKVRNLIAQALEVL